MKTRLTSNRTEPFLSKKTIRIIFSSIIIAFILFLFIGRTSSSPTSEITQTITNSNEQMHIAFAGGGWRAHTAHSAWIISLLDTGNKKLNDVFSHVGTISSNSGGSWFSTMLMYSDDFVADIESENAINTWTTTNGWIGHQRKHFDAAPCDLIPEGIYLECVFDHYTNKPHKGGAYWKSIVEKLIFKDYPLKGMTLGDPHQTWASDKPLLLAATLLKNTVILNKENDIENNHRYYQVCLAPAKPILNGDSGSECRQGTQTDVSLVTFSSISENSSYLPSHFFPELGTNANSSVFNIGYTADYVIEKAPKHLTTITLPLNNDNVPVMTAAAASSAALGFGASERITGMFDLSYDFEDDAVSFSLVNSTVQYIDAKGIGLKKLANQKIVRLADGGAVDNSGVAQLVRSLQLNNQAEGFNIVAFDNVRTIHELGKGAAHVGGDIANLFGFKDSICVNLKLTKYCVNTPSLQIFDSTALYATGATWTYGEGGNQLIYTKYAIVTKDNAALGISAGSKGTLHSFTCAYSDARTAPIDGDKNFDAYAAMFKFIIFGLNKNNGQGLKHLQTALGIYP